MLALLVVAASRLQQLATQHNILINLVRLTRLLHHRPGLGQPPLGHQPPRLSLLKNGSSHNTPNNLRPVCARAYHFLLSVCNHIPKKKHVNFFNFNPTDPNIGISKLMVSLPSFEHYFFYRILTTCGFCDEAAQ